MAAIKAGDRTAASSGAVGAADEEADEELERMASGGTVFESLVARERQTLWAILSSLFVLGFIVSTLVVHAERNGALESVAKLARDDAQLLTAHLTGSQFTKPVTGSSYDKLAGKIGRSLTKGSIVGATVWSSNGQILFSLNESVVGTTPADMQPLIVGIAQGSGGTRVVGDIVQTFLPVSKAPGKPIAVVQLDQPYALVKARVSAFWSMLRVGFALALILSLVLLGLTFVTSRSLARATEDEEPLAELDDDAADVEASNVEASGPPEEPRAEEPAPTLDQDPQILPPDLVEVADQDADQEVHQDNDLPADIELQELVRRREELAARAKEAGRRVKKLKAELHTAQSAPKSEQ